MEERITDLKDRNLEMAQENSDFKNEETLQELSYMMRKTNVRITGPPRGVEREKGAESIFREIVTEFLKPGEGTGQVQKANRTLYYLNAIRCSPRHYIEPVKS